MRKPVFFLRSYRTVKGRWSVNLLILNVSLKSGASRFLLCLFRLFFLDIWTKVLSFSDRQELQQTLDLFPGTDVVCLFTPLYVDSLPSHVVEFLVLAERCCKNQPCRFRLYALLQIALSFSTPAPFRADCGIPLPSRCLHDFSQQARAALHGESFFHDS